MAYNAFLVIEFIIILFCAFNSNKKNRNISILFMFIPFWFIHSFLDGMTFTADVPSYMEVYRWVQNVNLNKIVNEGISGVSMETGWLVMNKLISFGFSSPQWLIFFVGTAISLLYWKVFKDYSEIPWLSMFVFLLVFNYQSMHVLRQHLAMPLCLMSLKYVEKRKLLPFCLLVALAYSFHKSAMLFFPVYLLYYVEINKRFFIAWGIIASVLSSVAFVLSDFLIQFEMFSKYSAYADLTSSYIPLAIISIIWLGVTFMMNPTKIEDRYYKILYILLCVGVTIEIMGLFSPLGGRLNMYFTVSMVLLLPKCISQLESSKKFLAIFFYILFFLVIYFGSSSRGDYVDHAQLIF